MSDAVYLAVDDSELVRHLLEVVFSADGAIICAADGPEALEEIEKQPRIDAVILDVMMPGMDGVEVCHKIRSGETHQEVPIVMLTAKASRADEAASVKAGADLHMTKPFDPQTLREHIAELCEMTAEQRRQRRTQLAGTLST